MVTGHCVIGSFGGSIEYDAREHVMEAAGSCPCRHERPGTQCPFEIQRHDPGPTFFKETVSLNSSLSINSSLD